MSVPPAATRYWELRVPSSDEAAEGLTNFLWELGALGVTEEETTTTGYLRAFYPITAEPTQLAEQVRRYLDELGALGLPIEGGPAVLPVVDERWAEAWREHFRPLAVGERLLIAPPWEQPVAPGRQRIVIEPGRAFGTGHHATTRGCLEAIETITTSARLARAIDIGTGSGILAVAAALLGVRRVLAIDVDPDAVAAAALNADRNGVGERVQCLVADASEMPIEPAPLVVANLLTAAHRRLAARYATLVTPGGNLVLGGILERETADVASVIIPQGFQPLTYRPFEEWSTMLFARASHARAR